jgi:hypothetical protein
LAFAMAAGAPASGVMPNQFTTPLNAASISFPLPFGHCLVPVQYLHPMGQCSGLIREAGYGDLVAQPIPPL